MKLKIGSNIKRLRIQKGLTQEQLADRLNISKAAVSKWESDNTYPDITMLFPLAEVFSVSLDQLLGYSEAKVKEDINQLVKKYKELKFNGHFTQAKELITEARKQYPQDFSVMSLYMQSLISDNPVANREELLSVCNCILTDCRDETIRLEAINVKAKLLHTQGNTEKALELLSALPSWGGSSEQQKENLYAKGTSEYGYWNRRNCIGLTDAMANKLARCVWYDHNLSLKEKTSRLESMGDAVAGLCSRKGLEYFCIMAQMIYAELAGKLSSEGNVHDIIRIREKQFETMKRITELAESDPVLKESLLRTYKTTDILSWQVKWLMNSAHSQFARLRESTEYMEMLKRWS